MGQPKGKVQKIKTIKLQTLSEQGGGGGVGLSEIWQYQGVIS